MIEPIAEPLSVTTYVFDEQSRRVGVRDGRGREKRWEYDDVECTVWEVDAEGNARLWVFDPTPRPIPARDAETGQTIERLSAGAFSHENPHYRLLSFVDPRGGKTRYEYLDAAGKVRVTDPRGRTTVYDQPPLGRLLPVFDPRTGEVTQAVDRFADCTSYRYVIDEESADGAASDEAKG
jgi:YD repeat-containing protein